MFFRLPNMDNVHLSARSPGAAAFEPVGYQAPPPRRGVPQGIRFYANGVAGTFDSITSFER